VKPHVGGIEFGEMPLATYVGILLNLVLPQAPSVEGDAPLDHA
jgi:hypothetical protein